SEMVGMAAYKCKWFSQTTRFQRDLILVIMRSQRPLKLAVRPFGNLSMELFSK
ncbi:hypothetical protein L9F63_013157, partial [Diploptera punctata]